MAVKDEGRGEGVVGEGGRGGAVSKQPSRVGEVSQREEKQGAKGRKKYIKSAWRTFLEEGETHRCLFFRLQKRWR